MKSVWRIMALGTVSIVFTSCLKTRAIIKDDEPDSSQPIPAKIEPVKPQGLYAIDEIKSELTRMSGRIEELERSNQNRESAGEDSAHSNLQAMEIRIQELESAQADMLAELKKVQNSARHSENPEALLKQAKKFHSSKKYSEAIESADAYLSLPKIKSASEGTFIKAESYFAQKEFKKAIIEYSKLPEKYGKSPHVAASLYKIGLSFEALGMKNDAQSFYQELVDQFPKSKEAGHAKKKLKVKTAHQKNSGN